LIRTPAPGLRYMAYGAFWFSVMSLLVKQAGQTLPSQQVVLVRGLITLVLSWTLLRRAGVNPWGRNRPMLLLRGVFGFTALSLFYFSLVHLPLADASVIQYTNPVITAILAALILRERTGRIEALVLVGCLAGVVLITRPSFLFGTEARLEPWLVTIALIGASCSACAYVTIRKLTHEHPLVIVFYLPLVTVVGTLPLVGPSWAWPTTGEWIVLLGVGVATQIAQIYMTRGLQLEPAGRATAVGYLQIVFAGIWGVAFFDEIPDAWGIAGAGLIVGSTLAMAIWRGARRPRRAPIAALTQERGVAAPADARRIDPEEDEIAAGR
jgi:drug/metabolite transporter (DMT)-like permease